MEHSHDDRYPAPMTTLPHDEPPVVSADQVHAGETSTELLQRLLSFLAQSRILPGQRLPGERHLAEQMGVGRNVLREALKLLTALGFLEVRQGDGTYVTNKTSNLLPRVVEWGLYLGDHSIQALVEARSIVEVSLAGLAATNGEPNDLMRVEQIYAFMEAAAARRDVEAYAAADISFHLAIAKASGNPVLEGVIVNIRSLMQIWTNKVLNSHVDLDESLGLHLSIVDAIRTADAGRARAAMQKHMDEAIINLGKSTNTFPSNEHEQVESAQST